MAKKRKIVNLEVEEVSLVNKPANLRPFIFWKSQVDSEEDETTTDHIEKQFTKLGVSINTDGTQDGTSVSVNGKALRELKHIVVSITPLGSQDVAVFCEYTVAAKGEANGGFQASRTYTLHKAEDGTMVEIGKALEEDLENIQDYIDDLPAGLRRSLENVVGAVQKHEEPIDKNVVEGEPMPDANGQDGQPGNAGAASNQQQAPATVVDTAAIAAAVASQLREGLAQDVTAAVLAKLAEDQKAANDAAAVVAADRQTKIDSGELMEFPSEAEMEEQLSVEASQEAVESIESGGDGTP